MIMLKDKVTPQLRKRFLQEIKKSKETGKERGFHMCIEDNGKLSAGNTCIANNSNMLSKECSIIMSRKESPRRLSHSSLFS